MCVLLILIFLSRVPALISSCYHLMLATLTLTYLSRTLTIAFLWQPPPSIHPALHPSIYSCTFIRPSSPSLIFLLQCPLHPALISYPELTCTIICLRPLLLPPSPPRANSSSSNSLFAQPLRLTKLLRLWYLFPILHSLYHFSGRFLLSFFSFHGNMTFFLSPVWFWSLSTPETSPLPL